MASASSGSNLYTILGVVPNCFQEDITKAFRRQALSHHPDKGGDKEIFQRLVHAYSVLGNPISRRRYDLTGDFDERCQDGATSAENSFFEAFFGDEARGSDSRSADYRVHALSNYEEVNLKNVDAYFTDIAKVGLNYMLSLDDVDPSVEIVLLRHSRIDILYHGCVHPAFDPGVLR